MNKIDTFDLADHYVSNMGRGLSAAMDWEALGLFHSPPKGYHWTRQGLPDKRYRNYPEVAAYHDAELELRSHLINQSQREANT